MQTYARHRSCARVHLFALVALLGCAASPVDPPDDAGLDEEVSPSDDADASAPREGDGPLAGDTGTREPEAGAEGGGFTARDAARDGAADASPSTRDAAAAARDAESPGNTPPEARDAAVSAVDAAAPSAPDTADASAPVRDASATDAARADAASPAMPSGRCQKSSDCTELCVLTGILPCCREDRSCGCTWAPGAYCL